MTAPIDRNYLVIGLYKPDITLEKFTQVLKAVNSPALNEASACYDAVVNEGVSPAFALAIFKKESDYATDQTSMVVKHSTFNPGNCRSSTIGPQEIIPTEKGPFVRYKNWTDGFRDAAHRLVANDFDYSKAGAATIGTIIPIWAPASDKNRPDEYIATVVKLMNQWIGNNEVTPVAILPTITWTPSPNFDPGPTKKTMIIIHDIEGSFDSGNNWIDSRASGVSAHYEVSADGKRVDQSVKESDIAWHAGNYAYNEKAIGVEHEGFQSLSTGPYPDVMLRVSAALVAQICKRNGIAPNRQNIIGHSEVPPPNNHTDPGPKWPWDRYMAYVLNEYNGEGNQVAITFNPNPNNFSVGQGVLDTATKLRFEILTAEQFFSPNPDQPKGLTQRSYTWVKDSSGAIYMIVAIEDQDKDGNPLKTWTTQVWMQTI